jgi:hypothetical protein
MAYQLDDVPCSPFALTAEWLTSALCGDVPGALVAEFQVQAASSGTSERHNLHIVYNGAGCLAGLPEYLFTKSTPTLETRVSNGFCGNMVPQIEFFRHIRPELEIESPVAFHGAYDSNSFRSIILFEDLVHRKGARFCDWKSRLTREQAGQIITLLAAVAGRYFDDQRLSGQFAWLYTKSEMYIPIHEGIESDVYHERGIDEAIEIVPKEFVRRRKDLWSTARKALQAHDFYPRTVIHNDTHLGNVYITGDDRAGMCDWQCVCSGLWAGDFAYAVSAMLPVEDRRSWERELLRLYLDTFHHSAGRHIVSFDEAWALYRQQLSLALIVWTPTLCHHPDMPDMQSKEMSREMVLRITTAMSDLESFDA